MATIFDSPDGRQFIVRRGGQQFELFSEDMEHPVGPSMTVPDQSMTVQEILMKFTSGMDPGVVREGVYSDTEDFDDLDLSQVNSMDLVDREDLARENSQRIDDLNAELRAKQGKVEVQKRSKRLTSKPGEEERSDDDTSLEDPNV